MPLRAKPRNFKPTKISETTVYIRITPCYYIKTMVYIRLTLPCYYIKTMVNIRITPCYYIKRMVYTVVSEIFVGVLFSWFSWVSKIHEFKNPTKITYNNC